MKFRLIASILVLIAVFVGIALNSDLSVSSGNENNTSDDSGIKF